MQLVQLIDGHVCVIKESRKKQREVEEKRLATERAAEEARRKADEVTLRYKLNIVVV